MSFEFFWRLPVSGDGRFSHEDRWHRGDHRRVNTHQNDFARTGARRDGYTYYDHLSQIARAAELTGFTGLSIPQHAGGEEPLVVAGALAREVRRLTLLPTLPAYFLSAVYTAKISVSFQRLTAGRLAWNLVTEAPEPNAWHGHNWSVAEQIARTDEFLDVAKGFWTEEPFTYQGNYYEVENGALTGALSGQPFPRVYLSGDTAEALALSAKHADVHILSLDTPAAIRDRIATLDALAAGHGRTLRYALQADIVARHSDEAAHDHATRFGGHQPGQGAALVGGYETLADRFGEYRRLGIETFILSSRPHLEEAYRIGEQLLPLIRERVAGPVAAAA
jgi:alkanesulfonate monooxygenase